MEPAKGSTKCARNGVRDSSLMCQSSGKLKSNKKDMKYRGVRKHASRRFTARIRDPITKQRRCLGTYDTAELAASAYDFAARAMRGTRAKTNFLNVVFDPYKFAPSGPPTLGSNSSHPFLSKPSNLDSPLSNSVFHKPSQRQDHQFFGGSSSNLSSFWDKFGLTNQDIPASGHPITTNDCTLPCPVPLSQFFPVSSSPTACTLNMPLQPFLNKTTSAVTETISTTPCLPNPVFPLHHSFLPLVEELPSSPHSQQCSTVMPLHPFSSNAADCSCSDSSMLEKITNEFSPRPISNIESSSTTRSSACDINSTLDYGFDFLQESYSPTTPCTIIHSTTCLPNPVFPLLHSFLPLVEELPSSPHSQQCSTVMPLHPFISNAADCSYSDSKMLEKITNEFSPRPISTIESSSNTCSSACDINSTLDYGFDFPQESYFPTTPCTIIHSTTGLLNLDLPNGLYVNQNKQQWTEEYDIEKGLSSTQLSASCEFYDMPPTADFLLDDIPDVATLPLLDSIWD